MITKRIIPCLDIRNGRVVKGVNFEGIQDVADPVETVSYTHLQMKGLEFPNVENDTEPVYNGEVFHINVMTHGFLLYPYI